MVDETSVPIFKQISDYVAHYAQKTPEAEAAVFGPSRLSYRELEARVDQCAKALLATGIGKGDRVACLSTPRTEYWITFLATTKIGAVWLGLNPKYREQELKYVISDAKPKLIFSISEFEGTHFLPVLKRASANCKLTRPIVTLSGVAKDAMPWEAFLDQGEYASDDELAERQLLVDRLDPALLVYTSGTTGWPKGALLSHYGLCFGAAAQPDSGGTLSTKPRGVCNFPINHVACVADTCCVFLVSGGCIVFQERFDAGALLKAIEDEKLTSFGGVPTMLMMLLDHPNFETTDFSSVNLIGWGGAALPVPIIERLRAITPRLTNVYGMTETAANTTHASPDADLFELSETIGRPHPLMPCRIMNDDGVECAPGEHGELQFKGDYLFLEYLNRPEATRDAFTGDGWLRTGDIGYWHESGAISLVGRKSDMFKSGGYNVYPREIELLLESHDNIEMAAVVGVSDDRYQEVGAAFVILKKDSSTSAALTPDDIKSFCREHLANYKVPKHIAIVESLPTLPVGKVDKVTLMGDAMVALIEAEPNS